jgi:spermidine synthase
MNRLETRARTLPEVAFSDFGDVRYLHLGSPWVQGSMWLERPFEIHLEYLQRMMAGLLFLEPASLPRRHAMQLGLGGGALTKFCRKTLRMPTTVIEINPAVWQACRTWFKLPAPDSRLSVVLADAQTEIRRPQWQGGVDLLHVDLYDQDAACPVLDSQAFYADCHKLLSEDGQMTVNLFGRRASFAVSLERIAAAFGPQALWSFKPTREGNQVVLAQRQVQRPARAELLSRAADIQHRHKLPAGKWLRSFAPLHG